MYPRMVIVAGLMTLGFNIVASSPPGEIDYALLGWTLIGFSSTFLIGGFNDRPTARDNAAYAFAAYQVSDAALLVAAAFSAGVFGGDASGLPDNAQDIATLGLIIAASIKSSQFPLSGLFLRSMEGASPNSALGYAGISAHAGIVLLAGTTQLWGDLPWAHTLIGLIGAITVVQSTTVANVRADRKGGVASASSATLGALFIVLAAGYTDLALLLCLGHASFRMNQIVRSPGIIHDSIKWEGALGKPKVASKKELNSLWELGWVFNRINSDFLRLPDAYANVDLKQKALFYKPGLSQAVVGTAIVGTVAAFHYPAVDDFIEEALTHELFFVVVLLLANIVGLTALIRFLLGNVLDFGRFADRNDR